MMYVGSTFADLRLHTKIIKLLYILSNLSLTGSQKACARSANAVNDKFDNSLFLYVVVVENHSHI